LTTATLLTCNVIIMRKKIKNITGLTAILFLLSAQPAFAGEAPAPSIFSNPLAITFIVLMLLLLIVIGILANILVGAADAKRNTRKAERESLYQSKSAILSFLLLFTSSALFAQGTAATSSASNSTKAIAGMDASTFYLMAAILFIELLVIIALLLNIKLLLKKEKQKLVTPEELVATAEAEKNKISWWDKVNRLRPVSQEAELDLGHEYDGIRELNNRLPPWWLYGFYLSIVFAGIYLWRFHVSHNGPSSTQEYETAVARAEVSVQEYLKKKGESVDENTVTLLINEDDIQAGKALFIDPSKCPACHNTDGGGNAVGPNLVDEYWLYGGSVKDIFKTIKYGTSKGMRSWKDDLSAKQIAQLASYVKSLKGTKPANPKEPQGQVYKEEAPLKAATDSTATHAKG
jgi:cytochrome c oxidase cbb3-type subunit III